MVKGSRRRDATGHEKGRAGRKIRAASVLRTSWRRYREYGPEPAEPV